MSMYNESFVLYESVFRSFQRMYKRNKTKAADYINAVMEFGIDGVVPDEDDEIWDCGLDNAFASISKAKDRYTAAIENGKRGGRPAIELNEAEVMAKKDELKTWKAVAAHYGIDEDTLRKARKQWEKAEKPKNLNDNVNENVNENVNANEKENANENQMFLESTKRILKQLEEASPRFDGEQTFTYCSFLEELKTMPTARDKFVLATEIQEILVG